MSVDQKQVESHFAFGENWAEFSHVIDDARIAQAERDLIRLLGADSIAGRTMLDIGCGSGIHALAALRLGLSHLTAIDIDEHSVATSTKVLNALAPNRSFEVRRLSVFDLTPSTFGAFDIVYSWGVLHHTGAMYEAIERAAACVAPGGLFAVALYRKTWLCGFWRHEKRWYSRASAGTQKVVQALYTGLLRAAFLVKGRSFRDYVDSYKGKRGMSYKHDVHDWLGGYPYESLTPQQAHETLTRLGFEPVRNFVRSPRVGLVMGCDEFVYRRRATS